jgi:hypothetical protein
VSRERRVKWFFALTESTTSFRGYARMIRVAVHSALQNTSLDPHFLYDGTENELTAWLRAQGVTILPLRSWLYPQLQDLAAKLGKPAFVSIGAGALLRCELPALAAAGRITDPFVLYTDCDVLFLRDVADELIRMTPRFFAVAPQADRADFEAMNTGVMWMNLPALAADDAKFRAFVAQHLEEFSKTSWDQMAYRQFYGRARNGGKAQWDPLAPEFNWKPYWGVNPEARIVHFHGPKPSQRHLIASGNLPQSLVAMTGGGYDAYCDEWDRLLAGLS